MNEFELIERELSDLRSRFKSTFEVLENLVEAKKLYEDLSLMQNELQDCISQAKSVLAESAHQSSDELKEHYLQAQTENQQEFNSIRNEILRLKAEQEVLSTSLRNELENNDLELRRYSNNLEANLEKFPSPEKLDWLKHAVDNLSGLIYSNRQSIKSIESTLAHQKTSTTLFSIISIISFSICCIILLRLRFN